MALPHLGTFLGGDDELVLRILDCPDAIAAPFEANENAFNGVERHRRLSAQPRTQSQPWVVASTWTRLSCAVCKTIRQKSRCKA